jgi:hypothetical protein
MAASPEIEFFEINLTQVVCSMLFTYWRILQKTIVSYFLFLKFITKIREARKHEYYFANRKTRVGNQPKTWVWDDSSLCRSRIPSQDSLDSTQKASILTAAFVANDTGMLPGIVKVTCDPPSSSTKGGTPPKARDREYWWFVDCQAFSRSYDLAPPPSPPPPSAVSKLGLLRTGGLSKKDNFADGRGGGGGQGAKSYDGDKVWSSVNHSILSGKGFRVEVQWITCPRVLVANHWFADFPQSRDFPAI